MAIVGNFPGVYPNITDLSQVVNANSVTSCAYVGEAEFGPINTPTLVTNKKGYIDRFGEINPKYGYMGYSLAVAGDTIGQHYVVRVVNKDTARYGQAFVPLSGETEEQPEEGLTIDEVESAKKDSGALFRSISDESGDNSGEIVVDTKTAFKIVSDNPNNKDIRVKIEDSTINTNKNYRTLKTTISDNKVKVTIADEDVIKAGDTIVVTCPQWDSTDAETGETKVYSKKFTVDEIAKSYYFSTSIHNGGTNYKVGDILTLTGATLSDNTDLQVKVTRVGANGVVEKAVPMTGSDYNKLESSSPNGYQTTGGTGSDCVVKVYNKERSDVVVYTDTETHTPDNPDTLRIIKYPDLEETTFSVIVMEAKNKTVETVEVYNYVTLFPNKDQYGNSTFVEDVINGRSVYIQIFANPELETTSPVPAFGTYKVANNTSGENPEMTELVAAWDLFLDRTRTTVTLLMNCGYINEAENSYQSAMLKVAEKRRDCFCLFDVPSTATESDAVLDWRKNSQGFNTYRGAVFTPWVKTFDSVQGKRNFNMCPSAYIAKIMGEAGKPWIAAAGPNRGYYTSSVVTPTGLTSYYDEDTGGVLYQNQLNCGIKDVGGYANWGQKTLQMKPSALDRINVARTVIYIETTLREAARYHLFENNTAFERMQVTLQFSQFLDEVLNGGGLTRYQVVCDDSNNTPYIIAQNQMVIDIYLWPVYTTEFIALNTIVMGADAEVTVSSNA